jgi:carbonic anhydrase
MSVTDKVLQANEGYAAQFKFGHLSMPPRRKLAVLACMDARLDVELVLGLSPGDAHIIRNAGGIATEDALRSLVISTHLLGTEEFLVINHTDCGMLTFQDSELLQRLRREYGDSATGPSAFYAFSDVDRNVREQVQKIQSHKWIPQRIPVRGCVYDVKTGRLREVAAGEARTRTA